MFNMSFDIFSRVSPKHCPDNMTQVIYDMAIKGHVLLKLILQYYNSGSIQ